MLSLQQNQSSIERFLVKMEKRPSGNSHIGASAWKKDTEKVAEEQTSELQSVPSGVQSLEKEISEATVPAVLLEEDDDRDSSSSPI